MSWFAALKRWIVSSITGERSAHKIGLSCAWGMYIAISPFVGFHTVMVFFFSWLFSLNGAITLVVSKIVNNPLTVVPLYAVSHTFGGWILKTAAIDPFIFNPVWMQGFNEWIFAHIGLSGVSIAALLLGTHVIGIAAAALSYPIITWYARLYQERGTLPSINILSYSRETTQKFVATVKPLIMHVTKRRAHRSA